MDRASAIGLQAIRSAQAGWRWLLTEVRQIFDLEAFRSANNWSARVEAVSWRRFTVAAGGALAVTLALGLGLWLVQPKAAHAPRLPTEQEWRANQAAARAMEAELSPALAQANASVTP